PYGVQIGEVLLFLGIRYVRLFILELHGPAVSTFVAIRFIVQGLVTVAQKVNQNAQGICASFSFITCLELLRVFRNRVDDAALLAGFGDVVLVTRSIERNIDVVQWAAIRLFGAEIIRPT